MGIPNKDEVKGKIEKGVGRMKETVGVATDNEELEQEGRDEQLQGSVREGVHKARRKVGEAIESIGEDIKR